MMQNSSNPLVANTVRSVGRTAFGEALFTEVALRFGRLVLHFTAADRESVFAVSEAYAPFMVDPARHDAACVFRCSLGDPAAGPEELAYPAEGPWDLRRRVDGSEEMVFHFGRNRDFIGLSLTFDASFLTADIVEREIEVTTRNPATFDDPSWRPAVLRITTSPFIEYIVARLMPRNGGLHLHASLAIANGGAYVFAGHSGAGKSTIAGLAEQAGALVPSDDRLLITLTETGAEAWGTPWHGDLPRKSPDGAPLKAVYLLRQDRHDRVEPMPGPRAVKELYTRLVQPGLSALEVSLTLEHLERLITVVPVASLHFRPTPDAVRLAIEAYP